MLDSESSLRLHLLRFPLVVGVVLRHASSSTELSGKQLGVIQTDFVTKFVINFVSQGLLEYIPPLFFLMSGYLFFSGFEWSKEKYLLKLRTRIRTLLVPFLFWNIATLLLFTIALALPATQTYFAGDNPLRTSFGVFDYLNAIIGFNRMPIAYQFWFIRDLIILVLLVPFINILKKTICLPFLAIVFICWFFDFLPVPKNVWPFYVPYSSSVLFFCVGSYLASIGKSLFAIDKYGPIIVLSYFSIAVLVSTPTLNEEPFFGYLARIHIILGVMAALFMTKLLTRTENLKSLIIWLTSSSFFIFAAHEPLLKILRKVAYKSIPPDSSASFLALFFLLPIVVIAFLVVVYHILSCVVPRFVSIVTGGRNQ